VKDEDHQARGAAGSGLLLPQGRLSAGGDRTEVARSPRPQPRYRLKRSIDPFPASDGSLHLLRTGAGDDDFVLPEARAEDRLVIKHLARGFCTREALSKLLQARGLPATDLDQSLSLLTELDLLETSNDQPFLTEVERERYDRQLIYLADLAPPGVSAEVLQQRLGQSLVVLLGCGGLGSWTACALACAGVGELRLVDDDQVDLTNLNRQLLFGEADLGRPKVEAAAEALGRHNSELAIHQVRRRIHSADDLTDVLGGADLLIGTADWPAYELPRWINQAAQAAGTPYITAGQILPHVRVGPLVIPGQTACWECAERRWRQEFPLYDQLADHRTRHPREAATLGAASGLVGSLLAMEAIHLLSGGCRPATIETALILDLRTMELSRERIAPDPKCRFCSRSRATVFKDGGQPQPVQLAG
jgi:bacteriocin biosynthesis cyclodehydratase domain-containing protein